MQTQIGVTDMPQVQARKPKEEIGLDRVGMAFVDWMAALDVPTLEAVMSVMWVSLGLLVGIMTAKVIPIPPPYFQDFRLILPPWAWAFLFLSGGGVTIAGRFAGDTGIRLIGAYVSLVVAALIWGPLWPKAILASCMMMPLLAFQCVLVKRLQKLLGDERRANHRERSSDKDVEL